MSKGNTSLRSAIQDLNIQKPFHARPAPGQRSQAKVPQSEAPPAGGIRPETINGFFMMAHRIFSEPMIRSLPGDCFRIFLWMSAQAYRFKTSNGTVRASAKFVSAGVGVAESSVSRAFDALLKAKLIRRVEINYKLGNLWWVNPMAFGGGGPGEGTKTEVPHSRAPDSEGPEKRGVDTRNEVSSSPNSGVESPQNRGQINTSQETEPKNSLSSYFENLRPERKRQSERNAYLSLKKDYSHEEICDGFEQLRRMDPTFTKYHSPLAFLSQALPQVLRKSSRSRSERVRSDPSRRIDAETIAAKEDQLWREKEAAFRLAYPEPDAQAAAVKRYSNYLELSPVLSGTSLLRGIAITKWWEETQAQLSDKADSLLGDSERSHQ